MIDRSGERIFEPDGGRIGEPAADRLVAPVRAHARSALAAPELAGHLGERAVLEEVELESTTLALGQASHGLARPLDQRVRAGQAVLGRLDSGLDRAVDLDRLLAADVVSAQVVSNDVASDGHEPRAHRGAAAEVALGPMDTQEDLLHDVLGLGVAEPVASSDREHEGRRRLEEAAERWLVPAEPAFEEGRLAVDRLDPGHPRGASHDSPVTNRLLAHTDHVAHERTPQEPTKEPDQALLEGAWAGVETELGVERSLAGGLRRRPMAMRVSIALGAALGIPLLAVAVAPRADLAEISSVRGPLFLTITALLALGSAWLAARPLQARALGVRAVLGLAAAALGAALLFAIWPLGVDAPGAPEGHAFPRCGMASLGVGAMVLALAHTIRRDASGSIVGAGALGGVAALLTLGVVCSVDEVVHLLAGHAAPVALLIGLSILSYLRPARAPAERA